MEFKLIDHPMSDEEQQTMKRLQDDMVRMIQEKHDRVFYGIREETIDLEETEYEILN